MDLSSEQFLKGDRQALVTRLRIWQQHVLITHGVIAILFLSVALIMQIFAQLKPIAPESSLKNIAFTVLAITACLYFMLRYSQKQYNHQKLVEQGQIIEGSILRSKGKVTGNGETYWYSVRIDYHFLSPDQKEIVSHYERDRDDLSGQPLPSEGTPILVLYLHKDCFVML
jgi:hypothetical protein